MIAKISSGDFIKGLIHYNDSKVKEGEARFLGAVNIKSGINSLKAFNDINSLNKRVKKPNFHCSLNFAHGEVFNDDKLKNIANDYMEGMGLGSQPYLIYRHFDREHPHIHIVSTRINSQGLKISNSNDFRISTALTDILEIDYNLVKAKEQKKIPTYEHDHELQSKVNLLIQRGVGSYKSLLEGVLAAVLSNPNITSYKDFNRHLSDYNVQVSKIDFKDDRVGLKYSFYNENINSEGKIENITYGSSLKASILEGKPIDINLKERFLKNKKRRKSEKSVFKARVTKLLVGVKNFKEFSSVLKKESIKLHLHTNADNKLFGIGFEDSLTGFVFKGSEINLSVNKLETLFEPIESKSSARVGEGDYENTSDIINSILNVFDGHSATTIDDDELPRRKRKKKRR